MRPIWLATALWWVVLLFAAPARADPWFGFGQDRFEDRFVDGDIDEEDFVAMRFGGHTPTADVHGSTWVSVVGFSKGLLSGRNDLGAMLVLGLALDRIALGSVHKLGDRAHAGFWQPRFSAEAAPLPPEATPGLARNCVAAALRASGLGVDDGKLDALVARARASAWLPETRLRAMRLWDDASHVITTATTDTANFYDAAGANLVMEVRLTWRFDRLLYAGDEPTLERIRIERQDARTRLATHVLEVLFAWQRARVAVQEAPDSSREQIESRLKMDEAAETLDVLTSGWFSDQQSAAPLVSAPTAAAKVPSP